jgi:hypothetical protein
VDKVETLLADPIARARLGAAGQETYESRFALRNIVKRLEED